MTEADVPTCYRIHRVAFGTEFGLPDPMKFRGDSDVVRVRFGMYPEGCLVAEDNGEVVGFGMSNRWGSVGLLGPVCVNPTHWNRGIARELTGHNVDLFDKWGCTASGLLTNPSSPRHLRLYQTFGFWPRCLTIVMARETMEEASTEICENLPETLHNRDVIIEEIRALSSLAYAGLDMIAEIGAVLAHQLGAVLFFHEGGSLSGYAICHYGPGTESTSNVLYVKFGLVRPGAGARERFDQLVRHCIAYAAHKGLTRVIIGTNTARNDAYRVLLGHGFRGEFQGIRMHRPMLDIFDTPDSFVMDDWR